MGFSRLVLVDPENPDFDRIRKTATHEAADVVDALTITDSMDIALDQAQYVVGTTARLGKQRRKASTPTTLCPHIAEISNNNRVAILFGPEDRGLENTDIDRCDALIHIPTFGFSSINLAQAVMILCYELTVKRADIKKSTPRLAGKNELAEMYQALEDTLEAISYRNPQKPGHVINAFRDFFSRITLRSKEVVILRTFLSKIRAYGEAMYKKGCEDGAKKN
jgi:tRNA/rRNA methyltransferase